MVASLLLLGLLSIGLAYLWHRRIVGFKTLLLTIKSRFGDDTIERAHERGYANCISHQWTLEYIAQGKESKVGNSVRNFINDRTITGVFILGVLILPTAATLVILFYRSLALLGASLAVLIIAILLIRSSDNVMASYGLLSWLRTQDESELKENDVVFIAESIKTITNWRMKLLVIALLSLVAAPWGELLPQAIALATTGFFVAVFTLVYTPIAIVSHRTAVIVVIFLLPLGLALLYLLYGTNNRVLAYLNGDPLRNL